MKNGRIKKRITTIALLIIMAVVLTLTLTACGDDEIGEVKFTYNGQAVEKIDVEIGGEAFRIGAEVETGKDLSTDKLKIEWSIVGEALGASITEDGTFTPGDQAGEVTVQLKAKYKRKEKSATIIVAIHEKVLKSLEFGGEFRTEYIEGEVFDAQNLIVTAVYGYSRRTIEDHVIDTTPLEAGHSDVSVEYTENGVTVRGAIAVTVTQKTLQRIEITKLPDKTDYVEGQTFDTAGMTVTAVYEFKTAIIKDYRIVNTPLTPDTSKIVVSYTEAGVTKTSEVAVTVTKNYLESIEIASPASKTDYSSGEMLSVVGLVVKATYTNGSKRMVTGWSADLTEPLTVDDTAVKITYTEGDRGTKSVTYSIRVTERVLESLSVTVPSKTVYVEGEVFNNQGLEVQAHYSGGTHRAVTNYTLSVANRPLNLNDTSVYIVYTENGITVEGSIAITVETRVLTGIEIASDPNKTAYKTAETFDPKGLSIRAVYNDGRFKKPVSGFTVDLAGRKLTTENVAVIVSYTEADVTKSVSIAITVTPRTLTAISITDPPLKTVYDEGEYFDVLGMTVTAHYSDSDDAVAYGWTFDKINALKTQDAIVTVSYTEEGVTKTAELTITVNEAAVVDPSVAEVAAIIEALPEPNALTLENEDAVTYAKEKFDALTLELQAKVSNRDKLTAATEKIAELKKEQPPVPESEYIISYEPSDLKLHDFSYGQNPAVYKNSQGAVTLSEPVSLEAEANGFVFARWINKATGRTVTEISGLDGNVTYQAVYELTATVDIIVSNYADKNTELARLSGIKRVNDSGTYAYDLGASGIEETIFSGKGLLPLAFYVCNEDGSVSPAENDTIELNYASQIKVYAVAVKTRTVSIDPVSDGTISWTYKFTDDENIERIVHRSYAVNEASFNVPINGSVIVYAQNPLITDIVVDGTEVGLIYPARQYGFTLADGTDTVNVTFKYFVATTVIEFKGINTRTYSFETSKWDGKLNAEALNDIAFMFDEENNVYLNRYEIGENVLYYQDLKDHVFSGNTQVKVVRTSNRFTFTLNYSGGQYAVRNLVGKQSVYDALYTGVNAELKQLYDGIFNEIELYSDAALQNVFDAVSIRTTILRENIELYAANRTAARVSADSQNGDAVTVIDIPSASAERFMLYEKLPKPQKTTYIFAGWASEIGGQVLSANYIDIVIVNRNTDSTLYAVWHEIPADKVEVTLYSGRNDKTIGIYSSAATVGDVVEAATSLVYIGKTLIPSETVLSTLAVNRRISFALYAKAELIGSALIFVNIDACGGLLDENLPSYVALSTGTSGAYYGYELSEFVPTKDGETFVGWFTAAEGGVKIAGFAELNVSEETTIYARYAKEGEVDYTGEAFIGDWSITYNGEYGLISAALTLDKGGTYRYETFVNGALSARLNGIYRFENGAINLQTLVVENGNNMLGVGDLSIDILFCGDNILITDMLILGADTVDTYRHMLTNGAVKAANYIGGEVPGKYSLIVGSFENGVSIEQHSVLNLLENGTVSISVTVTVDGVIRENLDENGYYRIGEDRKVWLLSNGSMGVADITDILSLYVKDDQDYTGLVAVGSRSAADNGSWAFAEVLEITADGKLTLHKENNRYFTNLGIKNAYEYYATIQMADKQYSMTLVYEAVTGNIAVSVTDLQNGAVMSFNYKV